MECWGSGFRTVSYSSVAGDIWYWRRHRITGKIPFLQSSTRKLNDLVNTRVIAWEYLDQTIMDARAVSLIKLLLNKNPAERLSASQAKNHTWFSTLATSARQLRDIPLDTSSEIVNEIEKLGSLLVNNIPGSYPHTVIRTPPLTPEKRVKVARRKQPVKLEACITRRSARLASNRLRSVEQVEGHRLRRSPRKKGKAKKLWFDFTFSSLNVYSRSNRMNYYFVFNAPIFLQRLLVWQFALPASLSICITKPSSHSKQCSLG